MNAESPTYSYLNEILDSKPAVFTVNVQAVSVQAAVFRRLRSRSEKQFSRGAQGHTRRFRCLQLVLRLLSGRMIYSRRMLLAVGRGNGVQTRDRIVDFVEARAQRLIQRPQHSDGVQRMRHAAGQHMTVNSKCPLHEIGVRVRI